MAFIILKTCTRCAACLLECPSQSISEGKTQYYIDADTCDEHQACVAVCPVNAIVRMGEEPTTEEEEEEEEA